MCLNITVLLFSLAFLELLNIKAILNTAQELQAAVQTEIHQISLGTLLKHCTKISLLFVGVSQTPRM
jgi:hypothetical protein